MAFIPDVPDLDNTIGNDIPDIEATLENLKSAISQEHAWSDSDATQCVHDSSKVLPATGGTMSGAIAMGANKITGLGAPTNDNDATTKIFVANAVAGGGSTHAAAHTDGTDDIQSATNAQKGVMTSTQVSTLEDLDHAHSRATVLSLVLDSANPPTQAIVNNQPVYQFAAGADDIVYIRNVFVPEGFTTAKLHSWMSMSTAVAAKFISLNWVPVVNGVEKANIEYEKIGAIDTSEEGCVFDTGQTGLSGGEVIGGKFFRDVSGVALNHPGDFQLHALWIEWS